MLGIRTAETYVMTSCLAYRLLLQTKYVQGFLYVCMLFFTSQDDM